MKTGRTGKRREPLVVGWREWVGLPDLGIERIKAKMDTGARTSALHVEGLQFKEVSGLTIVSFRVLPIQRRKQPQISCEARLLDRRTIKSSSGHAALRPIIRTSLKLGPEILEIELSLVSRDQMGFRLLIGRQAMHRPFLVDPTRSYQLA
ncbi:MAG: ATP-dependent zinc protease [Spirochaetales bacterium]|nr:ATP-dependent zinc protease [Leptospiraceae bacterium]MCP5482405.1 ATP-dependent zinc protease [Spirochaetales bacterium]MCP5485891.1 ATP-dependent zinc protease [Spirochaetales bacterium]